MINRLENNYINSFIEKVNNTSTVVGIVGLGYVGLPLAIRFTEENFRVIGLDIDPIKIKSLAMGKSYIKHISHSDVKKHVNSGMLDASDDFSRIGEIDALILCLPTPLNNYREPDLSCITQTVESILPFLQRGQLISLESTTYPGTTEEELRSRIEGAGFKIGQNIFLAYSPEREDPGNKNFKTQEIPKVIGGSTLSCLDVAKALYGAVIDKIVPVSSTRTAEMTKLLENIYRAVNIGLVNELKIVADGMGIDIWEVIEAASTKPFGFTPFYPGPGLGGHCIPIDPFYLTWKAREFGIHTRFIELAGEVNTAMPKWVLGKLTEALNERRKPIKGSKILILGLSYKKNIDDMRESPSIELMLMLKDRGAFIQYSDPNFPSFPQMKRHSFKLKSVELTGSLLNDMDCVLVAADHDVFDYEMIQKNSQLILDTRGRYRDKFENVVIA